MGKLSDIFEPIKNLFDSLAHEFNFVFIEDNRYTQMITGLENTVKITFGALLIGIVIGIVIAAVRSTYDKNKEKMRRSGSPAYYILAFLNFICKVYLTVIRGTPVVVQLMISYFLIFVSVKDGVPVGIFAFGINSGAYVAESLRAGIQSVDAGQSEAARSLGLSELQCMVHIVIPQAIKNVIPAIGNELIALLKETSIVSMVGLVDLTNAAKIIGSGDKMATYLVPMVVAAAFYLAVVYLIIFGIRSIEKKLKQSEQHVDERKAEKCRIRMEKRLKAIDINYEKISMQKGQ